MKTDLELQRDVLEELQWEPMINAAQIGVAVHRGIVTLGGYVDSYLEKVTAEAAVKRIKDVKAVVEDIHVRPSDSSTRSDEEIAEAALHALKWHAEVPHQRIKIVVQKGHLTLDGDIDWQYQKDAAMNAVKTIVGVRGVSNFLFVKPRANASIVKEDIMRALARKADLQADHIDVIANGNRITLRGKVRTWAERQMAEYAAWSAPGVIAVTDELEVVS
jgi:osmotically-inducible protein OsmY